MSKVSYSLENKVLKINGASTELNAEVEKVVPIEDKLVVLVNRFSALDESVGTPNANVFLITSEGKIFWTIEGIGIEPGRASFYSNIYLKENGELIAVNIIGATCSIDKNTGKILKSIFTK